MRIALPWSPDAGSARYEAWARVATLFAGRDRGSWFLPDVDDEVPDTSDTLAVVLGEVDPDDLR